MHATSVALAVVVLSAASSLAIPTGPMGDSGVVYGRAATVTPKKDAAVGAGAAVTTTITVQPRPTECKLNEKPSAKQPKHGKGRKSHAGTSGEKGAAHHSSTTATSSLAAAVVARSVTPTVTPSATSKVDSAAPSDAPTSKVHTVVGKNGKTTVRHIVTATGVSTKCFAAPTATGNKTPVSPKVGSQAKLAARAADATTPTTPKSGTKKGAAGAGAAVTTTITVQPRPTECKLNEKPSAKQPKHGKGRKSHAGTSGEKVPAHPHSSATATSSPAAAVVARSVTPTVTPSATSKVDSTAPTDAPASKVHTVVGKNGKTTVKHIVTATGVSTKCFATPTGAPSRETPASGKQSPLAANKGKPRLTARDVDLLERYFSELDELD